MIGLQILIIIVFLDRVSSVLDCYESYAGFPVMCDERLELIEECYSFFRLNENNEWKMEDAGCYGDLLTFYKKSIEDPKVKFTSKAMFYASGNNTVLMTCLDSFCNDNATSTKTLEEIYFGKEPVQINEKKLILGSEDLFVMRSQDEDIVDTLLSE